MICPNTVEALAAYNTASGDMKIKAAFAYATGKHGERKAAFVF